MSEHEAYRTNPPNAAFKPWRPRSRYRPAMYGQTLNTLYSFGHNKLGYHPYAGVIFGPNGELYGTTPYGGEWGLGVVYELLPPASSGAAWTEVVLHSFNSNNGDGAPTTGLLLLGPKGVLYGTTGTNGVGGLGTVFQLKPPTGAGNHWQRGRTARLHWIERRRLESRGGPYVRPAQCAVRHHVHWRLKWVGTVYRLVPPSAQGGAWTEQILCSFTGGSMGWSRRARWRARTDGTIYGSTTYGGLEAGANLPASSASRPRRELDGDGLVRVRVPARRFGPSQRLVARPERRALRDRDREHKLQSAPTAAARSSNSVPRRRRAEPGPKRSCTRSPGSSIRRRKPAQLNTRAWARRRAVWHHRRRRN